MVINAFDPPVSGLLVGLAGEIFCVSGSECTRIKKKGKWDYFHGNEE